MISCCQRGNKSALTRTGATPATESMSSASPRESRQPGYTGGMSKDRPNQPFRYSLGALFFLMTWACIFLAVVTATKGSVPAIQSTLFLMIASGLYLAHLTGGVKRRSRSENPRLD